MDNIIEAIIQNKITLSIAVFIILIAQLILVLNIKRKGKQDTAIEEVFEKKLPNNLMAPIYGIIAAITALISAVIAFLS